MSVHLSACISAATLDGFPWNFVMGAFINICRKNPNLLKIGHCARRPKYLSLSPATMITSALSSSAVVSGSFDSPRGINVTRAGHNISVYVHSYLARTLSDFPGKFRNSASVKSRPLSLQFMLSSTLSSLSCRQRRKTYCRRNPRPQHECLEQWKFQICYITFSKFVIFIF